MAGSRAGRRQSGRGVCPVTTLSTGGGSAARPPNNPVLGLQFRSIPAPLPVYTLSVIWIEKGAGYVGQSYLGDGHVCAGWGDFAGAGECAGHGSGCARRVCARLAACHRRQRVLCVDRLAVRRRFAAAVARLAVVGRRFAVCAGPGICCIWPRALPWRRCVRRMTTAPRRSLACGAARCAGAEPKSLVGGDVGRECAGGGG